MEFQYHRPIRWLISAKSARLQRGSCRYSRAIQPNPRAKLFLRTNWSYWCTI